MYIEKIPKVRIYSEELKEQDKKNISKETSKAKNLLESINFSTNSEKDKKK